MYTSFDLHPYKFDEVKGMIFTLFQAQVNGNGRLKTMMESNREVHIELNYLCTICWGRVLNFLHGSIRGHDFRHDLQIDYEMVYKFRARK